jgi:hypothetical protein
MTIDSLIPLSYRPPKFDTISDAAEQTQTMRQMLDEIAMRDAYVVNNGEVDRAATLQNLYRINPQFGYKQGREWRIDDTQDEAARLREEQIKASTENAKLRGAAKRLTGPASQALGLFLKNGNVEEANQLYRQGVEANAALMTPDARAGYLRVMGDQFDPNNAEGLVRGDHPELQKMVGWFAKNQPQLITDEGDPVGPEDADYRFLRTAEPSTNQDPWWERPTTGKTSKAEDRKKWQQWFILLGGGDYNKGMKLMNSAKNIMTPGGPMINPFWREAEQVSGSARKTDINVYPNGALVPGNAGRNTIDDALFKAGARKQRLSEVKNQFKPEYLELQNVTADWWRNIKDQFGAASPQDKAKLDSFSKFYQVAFSDMNAAIKEASGATVTDGEAGRLEKEMPQPPQNPLDFGADGPARYAGKLDQSIRNLQLAEARLVWIKRNGYSLLEGADKMPLDRMPAMMQSRGNALLKDVEKKKGLKGEAAKKEVRRLLAEEFGLAQ